MPYYKGTIYKLRITGEERWSNVYRISALGALEAMSSLIQICELEKAVTYDMVMFYKLHLVEDGNPNNTRNAGAQGLGELASTGLGGILPLFNTVRVVFADAVKKPEQKYLRLGAQEANLTNGNWDGEFVSFIQTNYADPLLNMLAYVGPSGEPPISATVLGRVQNRQLSWHRRSRPGQHRGWVNN